MSKKVIFLTPFLILLLALVIFLPCEEKEVSITVEEENPGFIDQWKIMKGLENYSLPIDIRYRWHLEENKKNKKDSKTRLDSIQEIGPANVGGRTRSILIDLQDPAHYFAGSVSGGLWQSPDKGKTWYSTDDIAANLSVSSIAQDPFKKEYIYYSTGEPSGNSADVPGGGIFRSEDGGKTFETLPSTLTENFKYIWKIATSPVNPGYLYVATAKNGLHLSKNYGDTFDLIFSGNSEINDVEVFPDGSVLVSTNGRGIYRSADGETGFVKVNSGFPKNSYGRTLIAYCKDSARYAYALFAAPNGQSIEGFYKSADSGKTWVARSNPDVSLNYSLGWYALMLEVHHDNPDYVLTGSVNAGISRDGGVSWTRIDNSHSDYHFALSSSSDPGNFLIGNDGGVYRYQWSNTNSSVDLNSGYNVTQFYAGHYFPHGNLVIGGTQDNGSHRSMPNTMTFDKLYGADGGYAFVDQEQPFVSFISTQYGKIRRSTNTNDPNPSYQNVINDLDQNGDSDVDDGVWFINPFYGNPVEGSQLYYITQKRVWRTIDHADNWTPITNFIGGFISPGTQVIPYSLGMSYGINPTLFIGGRNGFFYRIENAREAQPGDEVNLRNSMPGNLRGGFIKDIEVHPWKPSIVYVAFSNYDTIPRIWKVTEALSDTPVWTPIHNDLPKELPVNAIKIDPASADSLIIIGTDFGIYTSINGGRNWVKEPLFPNVSVHQMQLRYPDRKLFAYTHGRGIWSARLTPFMSEWASLDEKSAKNRVIEVYPNPVSNTFKVRKPAGSGHLTGRIINLSGSEIIKFSISKQEEMIDMTGLPKGTYFLQATDGKSNFTNKVLKL